MVSSSRVTPSSLVTSNMSKMTVLKQPSVASGGVTMTATMRGRLAPTTRTLDLALDGPLRQEPNREQVVASTDDSRSPVSSTSTTSNKRSPRRPCSHSPPNVCESCSAAAGAGRLYVREEGRLEESPLLL